MKKVLQEVRFSAIILIVFSSLVNAQGPSYMVASMPYMPDAYNAGTSITLGDDQYSPSISIGFPFCFFGINYDSLIIGSNNIVCFDLSMAGSYCIWPIGTPVPSSSNPMNTIMAPWQDLLPTTGGHIYYNRTGVAPNRVFVVSYDSIPMYSCTGMVFTSQIKLYETSNIIEIFVESKPVCLQWNSGGAIECVQNATGTEAVVYAGRNYPAHWTTANEAVRFVPILGCATVLNSNIINGRIFVDNNQNCLDNSEPPMPNRIVTITPGPTYAYTDNAGYYSAFADTGTFTIAQDLSPLTPQFCPASNGSLSTSFSSYGNTSSGNNFADTVDYSCVDLSVSMGSWNFRPCFPSNYYIQCCNNFVTTVYNISVNVTIPDSVIFLSANYPATNISGNIWQFTLDSILSGQCITIITNDSISCDMTLGTVHCADATISSSLTDCLMSNNSDTECRTSINSLDPNEKRVASVNFPANGYIVNEFILSTDVLEYEIGFQNSGSAPAITVMVRDSISPYLDITSVEPGAASYPYTFSVFGNGVIQFTFAGINLPDSATSLEGSHGFVKFRIHQHANNQPGTIIDNSAAIYFDFNSPVLTNRTTDIIQSPTSVKPIVNNVRLQTFPSPFTDHAVVYFENINSTINKNDIHIYGITGNLVDGNVSISGLRQSGNQGSFNIENISLSAGLYMVKISGANGKIYSMKLAVAGR